MAAAAPPSWGASEQEQRERGACSRVESMIRETQPQTFEEGPLLESAVEVDEASSESVGELRFVP